MSLPLTDLSVRIQHLPVILVAVPFLGLMWVFAGVAAVAALDGTAAASAFDHEGTARTFVAGAVGIFLSQGASTVSEYFLDGTYREVNAQRALRTATWPIAVVGVAMMLGGVAVREGGASLLLVVALVGIKFLFDLVGAYRDRLRALDERTSIDFGWADEPPEWGPVDGTLSGAVDTVRPRPLAVLASGAVRAFRGERVIVLVAVPLVATVGFLLAGESGAARFFGLVTAALGGGFVAAGLVDHAVRYLSMEYRAGGAVVGYDRLLGEAQWRLPAWKVARATPERTVVDRLLGTETLVVEDDDRTVRLVHLRDASLVDPDADA